MPEQEHSIFINDEGQSIISRKQEPSIYLFTVDELNKAVGKNSTKVGYTTQQPHARIQQWQHSGPIYENLTNIGNIPAHFDTEDNQRIYFMDHALHKLLEEQDYGKLIDIPGVIQKYPHEHISREFYFNHNNPTQIITTDILHPYIKELKNRYLTHNHHGIKFYKDFHQSALPEIIEFKPVHSFEPRGFQQGFINNSSRYFITEYEKGNKNIEYLLTSPTRSGKSFMGMMLMKELFKYSTIMGKKHNIGLIVSGIADVMTEWQETVQSHTSFNQKTDDPNSSTTFHFITRTELLEKGEQAITEAFDNGAENVVIALTLQDLLGTHKGSKNKNFKAHDFLKTHKDGTSSIDFLILDESHFAAFNDEGELIAMFNQEEDANSHSKTMNKEDIEKSMEKAGNIIPRMGKLYVTATPYKALASGVKFSQHKKNLTIISKKQILEEAEHWTLDNPDKEDWESPYYGLPQHHYFGVDTHESIDDIFTVENGKFVHEISAKSLIHNFFGYSYQQDFLYPRIVSDPLYKEAGLGKHIIITVPSCASADAVEQCLKELAKNNSDFGYKVLNISSADQTHIYRKKSAYDIKREIQKADEQGEKTVVITVDRLTTGVTVKQWDTAVVWRKMNSAQKHDQFIGRNGTPYVKTITSDDGEIVKLVEKQNAAVISYAPEQTFDILYSNSITMAYVQQEENKTQSLHNLLDNELNISPIYTLSGGDHMVRMNATNILDVVNTANQNIGTQDYARKVSLNLSDFSLRSDLVEMMMTINNPGGSSSMKINAYGDLEVGDRTGKCQFVNNCEKEVVSVLEGFDIPDSYSQKFCKTHLILRVDLDAETENSNINKAEAQKAKKALDESVSKNDSAMKDAAKERKRLEEAFYFYVGLLFLFVVLSPRDEYSLNNIIDHIEDVSNTDSRRIAKHIGLDLNFLKSLRDSGVFNLSLDEHMYYMNNIFNNAVNGSDEAIQAALSILMNTLGKFSRNEIPTPEKVAGLLWDAMGLSTDDWTRIGVEGARVLDPGCKSAVALLEFMRRARENGIDPSTLKMFAVPTSPVTYEVIRKVYELYGWDIKNILFVDGVSNLNMLVLLELALEKKECLRKDSDDCPVHGGSKVAVSARKVLGVGSVGRFPLLKNFGSRVAFDIAVERFADTVIEGVLGNIFDKISVVGERGVARDFWESLVGNIEKFDFVVSNPPYQIETSSNRVKNNTMNIFDKFQLAGMLIADNTSMIYPAGRWWYKESSFRDCILNNKRLKKVIFYDTEKVKMLFGNAADITDGVSIVNIGNNEQEAFILSDHQNNMVELQHFSDGIYPINSRDVLIVKKIQEKGYSSIHNKKQIIKNEVKMTGGQLQDKIVSKIPVSSNYITENDNILKIYANVTGSMSGKSDYYLINKNSITSFIPKYKICVAQNIFEDYRKKLRTFILDNNTTFGRSAVSLRMFDSKQEADNFLYYTQTVFFEKLFRSSSIGREKNAAYFVPDLEDYTNDNPIFQDDEILGQNHEYYGLTLDQRLYKLFNLTQEEINIIENNSSKKL